MIRVILRWTAPVALVAAPAAAQQMVQTLPGTTAADKLAETMRRVGEHPTDLAALLSAGEQSLALGDLSGAASLFARADKVSPRNGRVKAGLASVLVRSERPGEALRLFVQAEQFGLAPGAFAADRGLAYDLIGDQARAQADYRLAIRSAPDDETRRRYALSLGIAGQQKEALAELDPLIRRNDRGAWRARAFVLAMGGNVTEASKIAGTMMPGQMAQGLRPFFAQLPALAPADRAFAVHFGEVHASAARMADARLAPTQPARPAAATAVLAAAPASRPVEVAAADVSRIAPAATRVPPPRSAAADGFAPAVTRVPGATTGIATVQPLPSAPAVPPAPAPSIRSASATPPLPLPVQTVATTTVLPATGAIARRTAPVAAPARAAAAPTSRSGADAILAKIIAGLTIPAAELAPTPPAPAAAGIRVVAEARAKTARDAAALRTADRIAARTPRREEPVEVAEARSSERAIGPRAGSKTRTAAADEATGKPRSAREAAAKDRKSAAESKKALATREAADAKKAAKAEPARIWVQVAGGANEDDLPKAWAAAQKQAPELAKRKGYSTRLRATNRVLTGPFKTDAEAQAFVNTLRKKGLSGFQFTSDKGQAITPLPRK